MDEFAIVRPPVVGRAPSFTSCHTHAVSPARSGASARAAALAARARALGAAQAEVHSLTMHEISALAQAAAKFFDALPLAEFSGTLLPSSARHARRIRHKVLHQVMVADESGATLRALLLGRDAQLRMFSARSSVARDFMSAIEPGQGFMAGINRDVADWTPRMRIAEFRPADVLEKLSVALDEVEQRLAIAERRIAAQREALAQGDFDRIRDSLGTSVPSQQGISPSAQRPASMRLTPGTGMRSIRQPAEQPAMPAPVARPQLPAGAAPAAAPASPPVPPERAAPAAAVPGVPVPAPAAAEAPAVPDPAPVPGVPVPAVAARPPAAPPVEGKPKGIAWLSRAVRAALRTPPLVPAIPETPAAPASPAPTPAAGPAAAEAAAPAAITPAA